MDPFSQNTQFRNHYSERVSFRFSIVIIISTQHLLSVFPSNSFVSPIIRSYSREVLVFSTFDVEICEAKLYFRSDCSLHLPTLEKVTSNISSVKFHQTRRNRF